MWSSVKTVPLISEKSDVYLLLKNNGWLFRFSIEEVLVESLRKEMAQRRIGETIYRF